MEHFYNYTACVVKPGNLVSPVKINERIFKKKGSRNGNGNTSSSRNTSKRGEFKIKLNTYVNYEPIKDEYISSRKNFLNVLVPPHIVKYANENK